MNKQQFLQHVHDTIEESEVQIEQGMTSDAQDALRNWREKRNAGAPSNTRRL
ncbi:MAG: hypothetical protein FWD06_02020 [Oscillospiraceae bacterium]|nr:hypothetical protein [Oscillospiraceae bacterium]